MLHAKGKLLRLFTQNIDSLEACAGIPAEAVVAAHGNFDSAHVAGKPSVVVPIAELREAVMSAGDEGRDAPSPEVAALNAKLPPVAVRKLNAKYGGLVKPAITFFGENLPPRFAERVREDFPRCKLLLVFGTSLKVQPFASLVRRVPVGTPRVLVNRDRVGEDLGMDFDGWQGNTSRDLFMQGDCDEGARKLCECLGWGEL